MPLLPNSFPQRFSEQRIRIVGMLRQWENNARPLRRNATYSVQTLIGQVERQAIRPSYLAELTWLKPRRGFLLAMVVLACCARGAGAVRGSREDWAQLLGCCGKTAYADLEYCVAEDWLVKLPQFKKHKSHGKHGEALDHRQLENWYQPGRKLVAAWKRFQAAQEAAGQRWRRIGLPPASKSQPAATEPPRSPDGKNYRPSAFSLERLKPLSTTDLNLSTDGFPAADAAVCDGDKVSPAATEVEGAPPQASARNGAVSAGDTAPYGGRKTANQQACFGGSLTVQDSRHRRKALPAEHLGALNAAAVDVMHARDLVRLYKSDSALSEDAMILARCLQESLDAGKQGGRG